MLEEPQGRGRPHSIASADNLTGSPRAPTSCTMLDAVRCALANPAAAGTLIVDSLPGPHSTAAATCAMMRQVEAFPARRHKKLQRESSLPPVSSYRSVKEGD